MLVLKRMQDNLKLKHLQTFFPKLTESNQQYVLGLIEGLKHAQGKGRLAVNNSTESIPVANYRSPEQKNVYK